MDHNELHRELRPLMFAVAYRMLGSVSDAEDVVQEALLRQRAAEAGTDIDAPKAYLAKVTTPLAIDHLRSAKARRESYAGIRLPEPLIGEEPDPAQHAEVG